MLSGMSLTGTLIAMGAAALGYWVVRSVMEPGEENGPEPAAPSVRKPIAFKTPTGRTDPRNMPALRGTKSKGTPSRTGSATAPRRDSGTYPWYVVLDVPSSAERSEIQEAFRRRLAKARADGDRNAMLQVLQAAAMVIRSPQRGRTTSR